jgi:hypothetical protein
MSTVSGTSSSGKTEEVLGAILKCLDAMDAKLARLDPINNKVTVPEAVIGELGAQQDTLAAAVECINLAHVMLATQVNWGRLCHASKRTATHPTPAAAAQTTVTTTAVTSFLQRTNWSFLNSTTPVTCCHG